MPPSSSRSRRTAWWSSERRSRFRAVSGQVEPICAGGILRCGQERGEARSPGATGEPCDESTAQRPAALRVAAWRTPAALRRSTDALRHRSCRRAWPIATPVRNADGSTWPDTALAPPVREPDRFLGCADEGLRLVDGLLVFGLGHAVVNNATARLHIHSFVFDERGAQGNAGVHGSVSGEIAHGAAIE